MNLISKRIGINDHFPIDRYSKAMFPDNKVYEDIIKNKTETADANYGPCMKNIYRSDEWIKEWIKHPWNKSLGKENTYYVYNISYSGINKPVKKYIEDKDDTVLYERANGVMYYDFDNIGKENVDIIKKSFFNVGYHHKCFQWFETSWSGNGCHIRIKCNLKFHNKIEWQFIYMHYLDILMKDIEKNMIDNINSWYEDNTIDWSCATITRGFAIPYNENGVIENEYFEEYSMPYKTLKELEILINAYAGGYWNKIITNKFLHNINHVTYNEANNRFVNMYNVEKIDIGKVKEQSGERFDYNWRLKCVTTLMNIYEGDKDKVRAACKYIYHFIKPYKNHTYEEMINNELEDKIFANGDMTYNASKDIIDDLQKYFGFIISKEIKTNEVYVNDILQSIYKNI